MKKTLILCVFAFFLSACTSSKYEENSTQNQQNSAVVKESTDLIQNKVKDKTKEEESVLTFKELYPKLKKSLLESVCEDYNVKEEQNT